MLPQHPLKRCELRSMASQEGLQLLNRCVRCGVAVDANRPQAARTFLRLPKLLRNPGDSASRKWNPCQSIGKTVNARSLQRPERRTIKTMPRGHPQPRQQVLVSQNFQPISNPLELRFFLLSGKLRPRVKRQ